MRGFKKGDPRISARIAIFAWERAGVKWSEIERIYSIYNRYDPDKTDEERYSWVQRLANYKRAGGKLTRRRIIAIIAAYNRINSYRKRQKDEQESSGDCLQILPQQVQA